MKGVRQTPAYLLFRKYLIFKFCLVTKKILIYGNLEKGANLANTLKGHYLFTKTGHASQTSLKAYPDQPHSNRKKC